MIRSDEGGSLRSSKMTVSRVGNYLQAQKIL